MKCPDFVSVWVDLQKHWILPFPQQLRTVSFFRSSTFVNTHIFQTPQSKCLSQALHSDLTTESFHAEPLMAFY